MSGVERESGDRIAEAVRDWAARRGYRIGFADSSLLEKVRSEIRGRVEVGSINPDLYRTQLDHLCGAQKGPAGGSRILIVAVRQPARTMKFILGDRSIEAVLPPTYVGYSGLPEIVRTDLQEAVGVHFRIGILEAPLKALAARIGLVRYGRNNVTYIEKFGSYFQLIAYITDMPLPPDPEQPPRTLPACENCEACMALCPAEAIGADRFLLAADRCLTLFSENEGNWPNYFQPGTLECLVGCLACQEICPENAGLLTFEPTGVSFSAEETAAILAGGARQGLAWERIRCKLASMRLSHYEPIIGRNLRALLR